MLVALALLSAEPGGPGIGAAIAGPDPMNLLVVVESGDSNISILDGDRLEPIFRFPTRGALSGGPEFSPDGRFAYFTSRGGWISKFDLRNLALAAEVRVGIESRNAAVSADGRLVAVANYQPRNIVILDADLNPVKTLPAADLAGKPSRVSAIYDAGPRKSFVAALQDVKEAWEISYDPKAEPVFDGLVHDYRMGEGIARPGYLNPRRIPLDGYLDDFLFSRDFRQVLGAFREEGRGMKRGQVVNLDIRRKIADLDLPGIPHPGGGIVWTRRGQAVMAIPNLSEGVVSVIETRNWKVIGSIPTPGPGLALRSHDNSPYAWIGAVAGLGRGDTLLVIDKDSLEVVAKLRPEPGKDLGPVEFTRDGRYVLASLGERRAEGGAVIVFDAGTLEEVKRIPMDRPMGGYNVGNELARSGRTGR
jgi:DNA-binding beta-propeller fold protein YncE